MGCLDGRPSQNDLNIRIGDIPNSFPVIADSAVNPNWELPFPPITRQRYFLRAS